MANFSYLENKVRFSQLKNESLLDYKFFKAQKFKHTIE